MKNRTKKCLNLDLGRLNRLIGFAVIIFLISKISPNHGSDNHALKIDRPPRALLPPIAALESSNYHITETASRTHPLRRARGDAGVCVARAVGADERTVWGNCFRSEERRVGKECRSRWS